MNTDAIEYWIIDAFFQILGLVPPSMGAAVGNLLGRIGYHADGRHRKIALSNLERAFGDNPGPRQRRRLARRVFQQLGQLLFEIGRYRRWRLEDGPRQIRMEGLHHYREALNRGRGVLVMTAHMGNWELMPMLAAMTPVRVHIVYRPLSYPPLNRYFEASRSRFGAGLIPTARSMRRILQVLGRGEAVAMLMDQNFDCHEGVFVDFFGHRACTNKGLALLARHTGAPVVPVFLIRHHGRFVAEIGPELPLIRTGDKTKDLEANTQRYNQIIENVVRRHPEQWFWVHQRWKTRPYHPWPGPQQRASGRCFSAACISLPPSR